MFEPIDAILCLIPILISALSLALMHWFPWHGGACPLGRIAAYSAGTAVVVGVPAATMLVAALLGQNRLEWFWIGLLLTNAAVSGGTVSLAYWIDSRHALTLEDESAARRD